jgi:hypothetical protein
MDQVLTIKGELCDLNTYIRAERGSRFAAATIKKDETERIWAECKIQKIGLQKKGCFIVFSWFAKDKRKDKDNIAFAKKFILDGLVDAHVLDEDRWDYISGFLDVFEVDEKNPRVEVHFGECPDEIKISKLFKIGL